MEICKISWQWLNLFLGTIHRRTYIIHEVKQTFRYCKVRLIICKLQFWLFSFTNRWTLVILSLRLHLPLYCCNYEHHTNISHKLGIPKIWWHHFLTSGKWKNMLRKFLSTYSHDFENLSDLVMSQYDTAHALDVIVKGMIYLEQGKYFQWFII